MIAVVCSDGSSEVHLADGEYWEPFQFQLPQNIPSSYVGEHGRVAYSVTGVIDRPWRFDHEAVTFFSVICNYDLNIVRRKELAMVRQELHQILITPCYHAGPLVCVR